MASSAQRQLLAGLRPRGVAALAEQLAGLWRRAEHDPHVVVPLVTIQFTSGTAVSGWVCAVGDVPSRDGLLLLVRAANSQVPASDVMFVDIGQVAAILLHQFAESAHLISPDAPAPPSARPPTLLALKQQIHHAQSRLTDQHGIAISWELDWAALPGTPEAIARLSVAVDEAAETLEQIVAETIGLAALRDQIHTIQIVAGSKPGVTRVGDTLILTLALDLPQEYASRLPKPLLRRAIEDVL